MSTPSLKALFAACFAMCLLNLPAMAQSPAPANDVKALGELDINRYLGTWNEIAAIPQFFQRKCVRGTQANYELVEDKATQAKQLRVLNSCEQEDGSRQQAEGRARYKAGGTPAQLEVSFLRLLGAYRFWAGGDYWVLGLGQASEAGAGTSAQNAQTPSGLTPSAPTPYTWAIIGHPTRKYAWVLARQTSLSASETEQIQNVLKQQGYDSCQLITTPQASQTPPGKAFC